MKSADTADERATRQALAFSHRYQEALAAYEAALEGTPKYRASLMAWRAKMLLCLGRLEDALAVFSEANEIESRNWSAQPYIEMIGTVQWVLGRRTEAMQTMRGAVDGILEGKLQYASRPGGIGQGLLLWYFAVSEGDTRMREHALNYLDRPDARASRDSWPGAVVLHVLGARDFGNVLSEATLARPRARASPYIRGRECLAIFYAAVKKRAESDEGACMDLMRQCHAIENPINQEEWYLARSEVDIR